MSTTDLDELRQRYQEERPRYQALAVEVATKLEAATRRAGLHCDIEPRAKEVSSFLKKVLRKNYASPWDDIRDKAGVRVVTVYEAQIGQVEEIVRGLFVVSHYEDKSVALKPETLSYLGVHFEVSLANVPTVTGEHDLNDLICEVQVHTRAQNLWATVSHELLYKPAHEAPAEISRSIFRLMALIELFDGEVARSREEILSLPGYEEAALLTMLEKHFYAFTGSSTDSALSIQVLSLLCPLLDMPEVNAYEPLLQSFVDDNQAKLGEIFIDYRGDDRNPFLSQPESLLIFERMTADRFQLAATWIQGLPPDLLRSLSDIWGTPIDV